MNRAASSPVAYFSTATTKTHNILEKTNGRAGDAAAAHSYLCAELCLLLTGALAGLAG
jgi:hypothetical protein